MRARYSQPRAGLRFRGIGWVVAGALAASGGCHEGTAVTPGNAAASKEPVVSTEAPPAGSSRAVATGRPEEVKPVPEKAMKAEEVPEKEPSPIEMEEEPQEGGVVGGVPGGVVGGVPGGVVGGVPGGIFGGQMGGVPTGAPPPPTGIRSVGDPGLKQKTCPPVGAPPYPQAARDAKVESLIVARCVVETSGSLTCQMIKTHEMLEKAVLGHLAKARVQPFTTMDDVPVRVTCNYVFRFKLN